MDANELKKRTRKISTIEGSLYSVHDGFGLRYITPYLLAVGKNSPYINTYVGLLTSIPSLLGNLVQLYSHKLMEKFKRKSIITSGVFLQSLTWLFFILIGFAFYFLQINANLALLLIILLYTLMTLFGAVVGPVWVSLMQDNVDSNKGDYFGTRNTITGIVSLASMLVAGFILDYLQLSHIFLGFALLFFISFLFRGSSGFLFLKHYEPKLKLEKGYYFTFYQFLKKTPQSNFAKFSLFIAFFMLATSIASPFFTVYVLKDLGFSYSKWIITVVASSLGSIIFMPIFGRFADKYGNMKVLELTGFLIPIIPLIWLVTIFLQGNILFYYICLIEFLAGLLWAGFNLSSSNFIYDAVSRQRIALCTSYYNILNGVGVFIGATLGGYLSSLNISLFGLNAILLVFILSAITRFIAYLLMLPKINEVREVIKFNLKDHTKNQINKLRKLSPKFLLDVFTINIIKPRPTEI